MKFDSTRLDELLSALDRQISLAGGHNVGLVVCGGSALAALGLVRRTTRDVDVLGLARTAPGGIVVERLERLPEPLASAALKVARDFNLPADWLNLGPAPQVGMGLPDGFGCRVEQRRYGSRLTVYYASRYDQVHFKLYAAVDQDSYHVQDLALLKPTGAELLAAARWTLTQDVSSTFRDSLKEFLRTSGHSDVTQDL
ncbi:MAG: hypothetical protein NTX53_10645 [candidate division WOR-3 bacterium]|nr:hypothetical protein [candidate division WOR-3 bacterium]